MWSDCVTLMPLKQVVRRCKMVLQQNAARQRCKATRLVVHECHNVQQRVWQQSAAQVQQGCSERIRQQSAAQFGCTDVARCSRDAAQVNGAAQFHLQNGPGVRGETRHNKQSGKDSMAHRNTRRKRWNKHTMSHPRQDASFIPNICTKPGVEFCHPEVMSSPPVSWLFCNDCVRTRSAIHTIIIASIISIAAAVTINNTIEIIIVFKKLLQIVKAIYKSHHSRNGKSQEPLKILQRKFDPEFLRLVPRGYEVRARNNRDRYSIPFGMKMETMEEASPCVDEIDVLHSIPLGMKMETMEVASPCVVEIDVLHCIPLGMKMETMEEASPCVDEIDVYHCIPLGMKMETMEEASPCVDEIDDRRVSFHTIGDENGNNGRSISMC
uniref:uncharacterized protein n=1 Tax=Myxine glutinosa TaxID=7769 RepID=UPI00358DE2B6